MVATGALKMKINSKEFRVRPEKKVILSDWPTIVKPFCKSKKQYQTLSAENVEKLSALQQLHYASNRYALLLIFPNAWRIGKLTIAVGVCSSTAPTLREGAHAGPDGGAWVPKGP